MSFINDFLTTHEDDALDQRRAKRYFEERDAKRRKQTWTDWDAELARLFDAKAENDLFSLILSKLSMESLSAHKKTASTQWRGSRYDFTEAVAHADDKTQEIALRIFKKYSAGHFATANDLKAYLAYMIKKLKGCSKRSAGKVTNSEGLFVRGVDEDGEAVPMDNPEIYNRISDDGNYARSLPAFIKGKDLRICELIREGRNNREIGEEIGLSVSAVDKRIERMRTSIRDRGLEKARNAQANCPACCQKGGAHHTPECLSSRTWMKKRGLTLDVNRGAA